MIKKSIIFAATLAAFAGQPALGMGDVSMGSTTIGLACDGPLAQDVCDHFETRMAQTYPEYTMTRGLADETAMTVTLVMEERSAISLSAQLVWDGPNAGAGRKITSGITGADINMRQLQFAVDSLIRNANLPL